MFEIGFLSIVWCAFGFLVSGWEVCMTVRCYYFLRDEDCWHDYYGLPRDRLIRLETPRFQMVERKTGRREYAHSQSTDSDNIIVLHF